MTDKTKEVLSLCVQNIIDERIPDFEDALFAGVTSDMDKDRVYTKMILNSISLSVDIAVQLICELLDTANVVPFTADDKHLQKFLLKLRTENASKSQSE